MFWFLKKDTQDENNNILNKIELGLKSLGIKRRQQDGDVNKLLRSSSMLSSMSNLGFLRCCVNKLRSKALAGLAQ